MFNRFSRRSRRQGDKKVGRKGGGWGRRKIQHEALEDRRMLALLGVGPLEEPLVGYNVDGSVNYDAASDLFSLDATPVAYTSPAAPFGFFASGDLDINILVDDTGALSGNFAGDDLVLVGDVDTDGDFLTDTSGTLLTGEIVAFGSLDSGNDNDLYDFRFTITGGLLAGEYVGKDIGVTTTSEGSTFTDDFTVNFSGNAKGELGGIDPLPSNPAIELEKLTNGVDADLVEESPEIAPGDTVTFTYEVTNTGDVDINFADLVVVDDNGTPGDTGDDFSPSFVASSDAGSDLVLSVGETWTYEFVTVADDLLVAGAPVVLDFDTDGGGSPLAAGTVVDNEYASLGVTVTSNDPVNNPAMIFDTANPTGGDTDLATPGYGLNNDTPLGNVLIISEDADSSDPDDNAGGGTLTFTYDEPVVIESLSILDIDNESGFIEVFDSSDTSLGVFNMADLGDNSLQEIDIDVAGVTRVDVTFSSSGAVADIVARRASSIGVYRNLGKASVVVNGETVAEATDPSGYTNPEPVAQLGSIGNYVFVDKDDNGIQNTGDLGINGVTVNLLDGSGNVIATTVTADDASGNAGFYLFYNLEAGDYQVEFVVPELVEFTTANAGDDSLDSDADVVTGRSQVITLAEGDQIRNVDAGVRSTVTIEKTIIKVEDYVNYHQNKRAGKVKGITIEYSEDLNELFVSVDFGVYRGRLTDGFTFVLTEGDWVTHADAGTYAIFYFDADVYRKHGGPVLNVFGYNGRYDAKSFRDVDGRGGASGADKIATSFDNSDGWVKELIVDTNWHTGTRTMSFRIDASKVNDHVPLTGVEWEGAQMGSMATFALDTYDGLYTRYGHDGYLKKWWYCRHGWMDGDWVDTQECVIECEVSIDEYFDEFGWDVSEFPGDSDGDPTTGPEDQMSDQDWEASVDFILENGAGFDFGDEAA